MSRVGSLKYECFLLPSGLLGRCSTIAGRKNKKNVGLECPYLYTV